ncbi:MAG: hypothetical protein AB1772_09515 [Candidatus Zixiibacteriota bacterium]
MKRFSLLLAVLIGALCCSPVAAQEADEESVKDFMEVGIYGGGALPMSSLSDWSVTTEGVTEKIGARFGFNVGFDVGHFLTPSLVVGVTMNYAQFGIEADEAEPRSMNHRLISPAAYVKYYFQGESNFLPYIKGHAGVDVVKFATRVYDGNIPGYEYRELSYNPAFAFGVGGGLFYYTFDYGGLYAEANYHTALTKDVEGDYGDLAYPFGETAGVIDIHAGIKVFFGGD